ncbi:MAG: AAA family ATP:ADP antiporter [Polyangiales bacterium]|jgi:AAA family ATP:ADP antiporter
MSTSQPPSPKRAAAEVRPHERGTVVLMTLAIFLLMVAYYVLKTIREPWILASGSAELKAYASAVQAAALIFVLPLFSYAVLRFDTKKLVLGLSLAFFVCLELFFFGARADIALGFVFYVWVGIFSLSAIALFWSVANDAFDKKTGERLFPIVTLGMTAGPVVGSKLGGLLFGWDFEIESVLQVAAVVLGLHLIVYLVLLQRPDMQLSSAKREGLPIAQSTMQGFQLVFARPYIRLVALLLILLNVANTTGEYILSTHVETLAAGREDARAIIGAFYGDFYFWVNISAVCIQLFLAGLLVRRFGLGGLLFVLPIIALGTYALVALGVGFHVFRWMKTAENAADYSLMNNAKAMLWLPTSREERFSAKQTVDTFFVRVGDLIAAGAVYVGTTFLEWGPRGFAFFNVFIVFTWLGTCWLLVRTYKERSSSRSEI